MDKEIFYTTGELAEIAGITYIGCDHIDYHGSADEYIKAKYNIAKNMCKSDCLVLNAEDENSMKLSLTAR